MEVRISECTVVAVLACTAVAALAFMAVAAACTAVVLAVCTAGAPVAVRSVGAEVAEAGHPEAKTEAVGGKTLTVFWQRPESKALLFI